MTDDQPVKEKSTILQLYAVFIVSLALSFVPHSAVQMISFLFLLAVIIAAPLYQWKAEEGSLLHNHMQYLNGTIWIGGLFLVISILILGFWVFTQSDQTAFYALFERIGNSPTIDEEDMRNVFSNFLNTNMALLVQASIVCLGPPLVYIFYRSVKAVTRAAKLYRMPYPKSWF